MYKILQVASCIQRGAVRSLRSVPCTLTRPLATSPHGNSDAETHDPVERGDREKYTLTSLLTSMVNDGRREWIDSVVDKRTTQVAVVFENAKNPSNVSAALRTIDIFGVQNVHVIESTYKFTPEGKRASKGADKFLSIERYTEVPDCVRALREKGYMLYAADLAPGSRAIEDLIPLPLPAERRDEKIALVFGNEVRGITQELRDQVDYSYLLPMTGATLSFNLSVSVALSLYHCHLAQLLGREKSEAERDALRQRMYAQSLGLSTEELERAMHSRYEDSTHG